MSTLENAILAEELKDALACKDKEPDSSDVLNGLYRLAQAINGDMTMYAWLISASPNEMQRTVAIACFHRDTNRTPTKDDLPQVWEKYNTVYKTKLRMMLSAAINDEIREEQRKERLQIDAARRQLREDLKKSHQPHVMGTVKEIAAKYNVSLSEVRRLKAEGRLEDLTRQKVVLDATSLTIEQLWNASKLVSWEFLDASEVLKRMMAEEIVDHTTTIDHVLTADELYKVGLFFNVVMTYKS